MKRNKNELSRVIVALVILVVPLVAISFVSPDFYDTLDVDQERILLRTAYPLLYVTVLAGILFRTWHDRKDRFQGSAIHGTYGKFLLVMIALDGLSFIWLILFRQISLAPVFQMFLFLQVALVSLIRTRLFLD